MSVLTTAFKKAELSLINQSNTSRKGQRAEKNHYFSKKKNLTSNFQADLSVES